MFECFVLFRTTSWKAHCVPGTLDLVRLWTRCFFFPANAHLATKRKKTCQAAFSLWLPFKPSRRNCTGGRSRSFEKRRAGTGTSNFRHHATSSVLKSGDLCSMGFLRWIFSRHSWWILFFISSHGNPSYSTLLKDTLSRNNVLLLISKVRDGWNAGRSIGFLFFRF